LVSSSTTRTRASGLVSVELAAVIGVTIPSSYLSISLAIIV
jgi:hypothetical protein